MIEKCVFLCRGQSGSIESQVFTEGSINVVIRDDKAENKPVGFICGQSVSDECELYRIAVLPEYRHQCIATQLMEYFINKCKSNGIKSIFLEVRCDNEPAKKLYEKHGFCEVGRRRNYYTEPVCDALIYKAEL
ncbi:MAG: ribosomal protein S18-alanine N-acetyltransferase [[Eubacterium] siraeum]